MDSGGSCCSCSIGRGLRLLEYCPQQEAGSQLDLDLDLDGRCRLRRGLGPLLRLVEQRPPKDTPAGYSSPPGGPFLPSSHPHPPHSTHPHPTHIHLCHEG